MVVQNWSGTAFRLLLKSAICGGMIRNLLRDFRVRDHFRFCIVALSLQWPFPHVHCQPTP